ncbi:MAG: SDR family NAD(P)-dependent oxidoreductase [Halioglobus sp.]|nr:SDR family NAD(P)-dependent oxidoreductase [Halioglobus sp.]
MSTHPALAANKVAVITGGADGIGFAAAQYYRSLGMRVCIADSNVERLAIAQQELGEVLAVSTDVSDAAQVAALKDTVYTNYGAVDVLMNNAGSGFGSQSWGGVDAWRTTLEVNLFGVIHGVQTFLPEMLEQGTPGLVINTGSKQGITNPPGDPAYNTSKAAIRALTEHLQHDLRNTEDCAVSAHLLVPGFTYTGLIKQFLPEKPDGAWWPEQVIQHMVEALGTGDFYILCPDNDVSREMDNKRMAWAMGDLVENRPPLSRWHPDFAEAFERYLSE